MRNTWVSLSNRLMIFTAVLLLLLTSSPLSAQDGEALFKANCTACHKIDKKMIGPALQGAKAKWAERTGSDEAIISWVKNSTAYMKTSGDDYAISLFEEYNKTLMTPMALTSEEVIAVLDYVDNWVPTGGGPVVVTGDGVSVASTEETSDPTLWLIVAAIVLFIVFRVLYGVSKNLDRLNSQREEVELSEEKGMYSDFLGLFKRYKVVTAILGLLVFGYISILGWDSIGSIGVYQGYQPTQPIWFSHKIHAGQNGINCVYCHNSVEKGKAAGIPSVNICMNCHMGVQEGKVSGTKEIAKIYDAIGWDPDKNQYIEGYDQKPIEWVRIHNLQDFVYFNHSQHVVVGKQECQTCHGQIQEMDEVYQYSELTMGWCINCHRETKVTMKDNGYYEEIHSELTEKYKDEGLESFTVEQIGGLECVKCHY
ncbi:MAG: c-type cytochrome [Salibacteraceae bacterium]|nr:c-type cytochrome [Salibacteraceae bacterium]MDP4934812.1 c-type cytochrome [Salibacteraceae bacterium]MDP4963973.1 c-type cytochrome [Salibacteraceae bacterium]